MILFKVLPAVDILVGIMCIGIIYPCIIHETVLLIDACLFVFCLFDVLI